MHVFTGLDVMDMVPLVLVDETVEIPSGADDGQWARWAWTGFGDCLH